VDFWRNDRFWRQQTSRFRFWFFGSQNMDRIYRPNWTTQSPAYNQPHASRWDSTSTDTNYRIWSPSSPPAPFPTCPQGCPVSMCSTDANFVVGLQYVQVRWLVSALQRLYSSWKACVIEIALCLADVAILIAFSRGQSIQFLIAIQLSFIASSLISQLPPLNGLYVHCVFSRH